MSEYLRKTLVGRLQINEAHRDKTPTLGRLVPKLNLYQDKSCTIIKKEKLQPLSPFLTKRTEGVTDRTNVEVIVNKVPESKTLHSKFSLKSMSKLKPLHFHGDTKFWDPEMNLVGFIKKIKENTEFHDDFWYFNKGSHAYDLILTTFSGKNPLDYFTLSYRGISHFYNGEIQFISLEEWERENFLFHKFKKIPFFNKYRKWKTFSLWMKRRRMNMIEHRKLFLKKNLSFLDEDLQSTFLITRQKCYIVSKLDIFDLAADQLRTLQQFTDQQKEKAKNRMKDLAGLHENVYLSVKSVCSVTTERFVRSNITGSILDKGEIISSKVLPYTHEAVMRNHLQHLGKFIKIVDYMMLDSKFSLCANLYSKVFQYLKITPRERMSKISKSLFLIFCCYEENEFNREPEVGDFKFAIEKSLKRCVKYTFSFKNLEDSPDFVNYFRALNEFSYEVLQESLRPETILQLNPEVKTLIHRTGKLLNQYSEEIQEFSLTWHPYFKQYTLNKKIKLKKFQNLDIESLIHLIDKYKKQLKLFQSLPESTQINVFRLDLTQIKNKLIPSSLEVLEKLQKFLPSLAFSRATSLSHDLSLMNQKLFFVPKDIHEYVILLESIKNIEEHVEKTALRVLDLKEFIEMLEKFNMAVSSELKDKSIEISKFYEKLRNRLSFLYMKYETDKAKFTKILRTEIKQVPARLEAVQQQLTNQIFMYTNSVPGKIVEILRPVSYELENLYKDSQSFLSYQDILGLPRIDFDTAVSKTMKNFKILFSMWNSLALWDQKNIFWGFTYLKDFQVQEVKQDIEKFNKNGQKYKLLEAEGNFVGQFFLDKIEAVRKLVVVVELLQNPAIKLRHLKNIEEKIGFGLEMEQKGLIFSALFGRNLEGFTEEISEIVTRACKEEEIDSTAARMLDVWEIEEFLQMDYTQKEAFMQKKFEKPKVVYKPKTKNEETFEENEYEEDLED